MPIIIIWLFIFIGLVASAICWSEKLLTEASISSIFSLSLLVWVIYAITMSVPPPKEVGIFPIHQINGTSYIFLSPNYNVNMNQKLGKSFLAGGLIKVTKNEKHWYAGIDFLEGSSYNYEECKPETQSPSGSKEN